MIENNQINLKLVEKTPLGYCLTKKGILPASLIKVLKWGHFENLIHSTWYFNVNLTHMTICKLYCFYQFNVNLSIN